MQYIILAVFGFLGAVLVFSSLFTVQQQTHAVIERFGKFLKVAGPGLNFKIPLIDTITGRVTHRVRELEIKVESKTRDDVFVDLLIAVQYFVEENLDAVKLAHYKLTSPHQQMSSYVFDTVRALVPNAASLLRPGMLVNVTLATDEYEALVIPEQALVPEQSRQYVFVVDGDSKVVRREVQIGRREPGRVEIVGGLAQGERIVVEGTQKVHDGIAVREARG